MGYSYASFVPEHRRPPIDLLRFDSGPAARSKYRLWALVRMSGKWPLPVYGGDELPLVLGVCPACGEKNVTVTHTLCDCAGVEVARRSLHAAVSCPSERSA